MGAASLQFDVRGLAWRELWRTLSGCMAGDCIHLRSFWRRARLARAAVRIDGNRYCADHCLDEALLRSLARARLASPRSGSAHRIPLGLLLLSRQQLSPEQLQLALEAQRSKGHGRLGDWLQRLGYSTEQEIMAALARQWSCPVLHPDFSPRADRKIPDIPFTLLRTHTMTPVDYVEATATLHIAFAESVDYSVLYAIEQMLACRTEACMALPRFVQSQLQSLAEPRDNPELVFGGTCDLRETSRIIRSYCERISASEIRMAGCGRYLWVRLMRPRPLPLDLLFRSSISTPGVDVT